MPGVDRGCGGKGNNLGQVTTYPDMYEVNLGFSGLLGVYWRFGIVKKGVFWLPLLSMFPNSVLAPALDLTFFFCFRWNKN